MALCLNPKIIDTMERALRLSPEIIDNMERALCLKSELQTARKGRFA
jgi:hypothetical protein